MRARIELSATTRTGGSGPKNALVRGDNRGKQGGWRLTENVQQLISVTAATNAYAR